MLCADQEREQKGLCSVYSRMLSGLYTQVAWHEAGVQQLTDRSPLCCNWTEFMWFDDNVETAEVDNFIMKFGLMVKSH